MSDLDEIRYVLLDNGIWYEDRSYLNAYGEFGKLRVPVKTENVNFNIWFIVDPEKYGIQTRVLDFFQFEPDKRDKVIVAANEANSKWVICKFVVYENYISVEYDITARTTNVGWVAYEIIKDRFKDILNRAYPIFAEAVSEKCNGEDTHNENSDC